MKFIRSILHAINGIKSCFISGSNFRIQVVVGLVTLCLGLLLHISGTEWMITILCITVVLAMEMLNTAIEKLCNMVEQDIHPEIKVIKDIAAGAVFITAIGSFVTGLIIFVPRIVMFIFSN